MSIVACCGHTLTEEEDLGVKLHLQEMTLDYDTDRFVRAVSFGNYCKKCAERFESYGAVLHNQEEIDAYLHGQQMVKP
jgi:hypothetical protein